MTLSADDLYELLPAMLRTADAAAGAPLQALIGVIAEQVGVLDDDMRRFYADQFIETCAPWVVPYIGDLIGWAGLADGVPGAQASRAEVGNTIGYRRRKGTVIALEQVARDVTGRPALVVEFFRRLATTESLHHIRPHHAGFADLRRGAQLEQIGTAFDTLNRTADLRRIVPPSPSSLSPDPTPLDTTLHGGGRFNIPDLGAFVWRWKPYQVSGQPAGRVAVTGQPAGTVDAWRFLFSPLGANMPLFNAVPTLPSFSALTTRMDVPQPIGRRELAANMASFYGNVAGTAADGTPLPKSLAIYNAGTLVPEAQIAACNLADFGTGWAPGPAGMVAVDPELGRIAFPASQAAPGAVTVDYNYGFPMDFGGGPYSRAGAVPTGATWQVTVGAGGITTIAQAVAAFNAPPAKTSGLILLQGFASYTEELTGANAISIQPSCTLAIVAVQADATAEHSRVTLIGDIAVTGVAASAGAPAAIAQAQLQLSGLLVTGTITVAGAQPVTVVVQDCTLVPGLGVQPGGQAKSPGAASVTVSNAGSSLVLDRCITGALLVHAEASARVTASVVDAGSATGVAYAGPDGASEGGPLQAEQATIIGKVHTQLMSLASNTIFFASLAAGDTWPFALWCTRQQAGCLRFCALPDTTQTPRTYRCLSSAFAPHFQTLTYGQPSYGLLSGTCPAAVWQGADDESQIGAFHDLYESQGVANLRARLTEYAPFVLESGIFLIPSRPEATLPAAAPGAQPLVINEADELAADAVPAPRL